MHILNIKHLIIECYIGSKLYTMHHHTIITQLLLLKKLILYKNLHGNWNCANPNFTVCDSAAKIIDCYDKPGNISMHMIYC